MNDTNTVVKRVGIIFGLILILAVVVIFVIVKNKATKNVDKPNDISSEVTQNVEEKVENVENVEPVKVEETKEPEIQVIEKEKIEYLSQIKDIDEESLGKDYVTKEVLVRIAKKGIMLLDNNPQGSDNKELSCYFKCFGPSGEELNVFVAKSAYDMYKVNDTLIVNYAVYTNVNGIEFPLILSVKDANQTNTVIEENIENIENNEDSSNS